MSASRSSLPSSFHAEDDRLDFAPPARRGMGRAVVLAVVAHLLLLAALTWNLRWNTESEEVAAQAELWSRVPAQAAPRVVEPPPPPPPKPEPRPVVRAPVAKPEPKPEPKLRDAQIAIEREKEKKLAEEKKREEELQKKQLEARKKKEAQEKERKEQLAEEKKKRELAEEKKREQLAEEKKKREQQLAEDKKKREQADEKKKLAEEKKRKEQQLAEDLRKENLARMMRGASEGGGSPSSTGTAARSSGPSGSWAGKVQSAVRPNIVFSDDINGNAAADVEVRLAPDGSIVGKRLVKSSGHKSWDEAVLRALDKTDVLPRDIDGRVPTPVIISFRPKG